jgi:hypothetical protein
LKTSDLPLVLDRMERRALIYTLKTDHHRRVIVDMSLGIRDAEQLTEILADYSPRRTKGRIRIRGIAADTLLGDLMPHLTPATRKKAVAVIERARKAREEHATRRAEASICSTDSEVSNLDGSKAVPPAA